MSATAASRKASGSKPAAAKKASKTSDSEDDEIVKYADSPPTRSTAPKRAARTAVKYIEVTSDDDGDEDDSMFNDD